MVNPHVLAALYIAPPAGTFWRWTADAEVLTWADGTTIAFRPELLHVLSRIAPGGLPPFPAVVLLLAACREKWQGPAHRSLIGIDPFVERFGPREGSATPQWLSVILDGLETVGSLRPELRTGAEAKALLAELVFAAPKGRGSPEDAALVVQALAEGLNPEALMGEAPTEGAYHALLKDLEVLREGIARIDEPALLLRTRTGLDRLVAPADLDLPVCDRVRRLLADLRDDRELAGLSRLAHDLMAAIHVPRAMSQRDDLPLGGVSDISNRGTLDRLLISELAHDDLTFAVRIATNEALYMRREAPPRLPPGKRLIVLDAGIRMWGVPRVFATAVGLAFAATADRRLEVLSYRVRGDELEPVDLTSRAGLIAHLDTLEPEPHAGPALSAFVALAREGGDASEAILVTHEDAVADPEFVAAASALERTLYVAVVDRDGGFRLLAWSRRGSRRLSEARLSLEDLLAPPARPGIGGPLLVEGRDPALPEILARMPFPLLLPHPVDARMARWSPAHGVVALTHDGRVMHWRRKGNGAHELSATAPRGTLFGAGIEESGHAWFMVGGYPDAHAALEAWTGDVELPRRPRAGPALRAIGVDLLSGECSLTEVPASGYPPLGLCSHLGAVFVIFKRQIDVIDVRTGDRPRTVAIPAGIRWRCGRFFFQAPDRWHALAYDGSGARLEPVPIAGPNAPRGIIALFDRQGCDGPWALCEHGGVVSLASGESYPLSAARAERQGAVQVRGISQDGHRLAVRVPGASVWTQLLFDLGERRSFPIQGSPHRWLEPEIDRWTGNAFILRRKVNGAGFDEEGGLWLRTTTGRQLQLVLAGARNELYWQVGPARSPGRDYVAFAQSGRPPRTGYDLRVATWADGSRVYLDSRGMVHLKSADPDLPELTLVLHDGATAAWSTDGCRHGPPFFQGEASVMDGRPMFKTVQRFAAGLR